MITCSILSYLWDMWSSRVLFYLCMYLSLVTYVLTVGIFHCSWLFSSKITPISLVIFFWFPEWGHLLDHHVPLTRPSAVEIPLPQMLSRFFPPLNVLLVLSKVFSSRALWGRREQRFYRLCRDSAVEAVIFDLHWKPAPVFHNRVQDVPTCRGS